MAAILSVDRLVSKDEQTVLNLAGSNPTINDVGFFGMGQEWGDVTSERLIGVTYTNTSGSPIQIMIGYDGGPYDSGIIVNSESLPTASATQLEFRIEHATIPPGASYSFSSIGALRQWSELRTPTI